MPRMINPKIAETFEAFEAQFGRMPPGYYKELDRLAALDKAEEKSESAPDKSA